jgi:undecaprenyl-diphosphatase
MIKYTYCIVLLLNVIGYSYSQDTINFKLYDSLKTSGEDTHKKVEYSYSRSRHFKSNDPDNLDVRLFRTINNARSPFKDGFFDLFDRSMAPVAILFPASLFIYARAYDKTYDENTAYLLTAAELTNGALTFGTKMTVRRKRPLRALEHVYTKGMPAIDVYSFPSGHSSTTFSIATMFALRYPKYPQIYAPMYAWALIVAYGRPYFGMHYPSDLLSGAILGAGSSVLIYSLRKELFKFKNNLLNEDKSDEGSIKAGTLSFFVGSFAASAIVNTFIFKPGPTKRLFVSPWIYNNGGGMNLNWKF